VEEEEEVIIREQGDYSLKLYSTLRVTTGIAYI
jgi:hypothetical protein